MKLEEKLGKGGDTAKKQEKGETRRKNGKKGRHGEKMGKRGDTAKNREKGETQRKKAFTGS